MSLNTARISEAQAIDVDRWVYPGMQLHRVFDELRGQGPVVPVQFMGTPAWMITCGAAMRQAFNNTEAFPPHIPYKLGIEPVIGQTFQTMEGREHRFYRKLATPSFRPRVVEQMDSTMLADVAEELISAFASEGRADLVARFTEQYPYRVIARMLGIPREAEDQFTRWVTRILHFNWEPELALRCRDELWAYLDPVIKDRRKRPRDDVISQLIHGELDGVRLTPDQVKSHIGIMFAAGSSTTHDSIGNLLFGLLSTEGCWQQVREEPVLRDNAIEEALRWEPAVSVLPRVTRSGESVELGGVELPPDSFILMGIAGVNHDPHVFQDPHRFDIHRNSAGKITFGHGPRMCPGMHLARRELRETLDIVIDHLPDLRLVDPAPSAPIGSIFRSAPQLHCTF